MSVVEEIHGSEKLREVLIFDCSLRVASQNGPAYL